MTAHLDGRVAGGSSRLLMLWPAAWLSVLAGLLLLSPLGGWLLLVACSKPWLWRCSSGPLAAPLTLKGQNFMLYTTHRMGRLMCACAGRSDAARTLDV